MKLIYSMVVLALCALMVMLVGCDKNTISSTIDGLVNVATPQITNVEPAELYGGQVLKIYGSNFATDDPSKNIVIFGFSEGFGYASARADSATSSMLVVTTPQVGGMNDDVTKVVVTRADAQNTEWSEGVDITFKKIMDVIDTGLEAIKGGICFDTDGNMFVREWGDIYKVAPDGQTTYISTTNWADGEMAFGPDGYIYACTAWWTNSDGYSGTIFKVPPEGGDAVEAYSANRCRNIDFTEDGTLYYMCTRGYDPYGIFKILPGTTESVNVLTDICSTSSLRIWNDYLYWYTRQGWGDDKFEGLTRAPLNNLAAQEVIFADDGYSASGIAVDDNGNIYLMVGWGFNDFVRYNVSRNQFETLLKLPTENPNFATFNGEFLYVAAGVANGNIYKIYLGVSGAPKNIWGS